MPIDPTLATEAYCYLTTTGRVSGEPREIEIWFALEGATLYMLAGGQTNWVRNIAKTPEVTVRIRDEQLRGHARAVAPHTAEDARARTLLLAKYDPTYPGDLSDWGQTALPIAVDLDA